MKTLTLFLSALIVSFSAHSIPRLSKNIMISGPSELALQTGLDVHARGGNIVDVIVSYALTLSVTHPFYGSLGGGGFALVSMGDDAPEAFDFREEAPSKMGRDYYMKKKKGSSITGGTAVGVPGIPMGLWEMHQQHGKLPWKSLFKDALKYAKKGFPTSAEWYRITTREAKRFWNPGRRHMLIENKIPLPGEVLKQPGLLQALKMFRKKGPAGFYQGKVAEDLVESVTASGGDMTLKDLQDYKVKVRLPIQTQFEGHTLYFMPPPSSGGIVLKTAFELARRLRLKKYKALSLNELHLLSEIMSRSFRARSLLGDPDFHRNPLSKIDSQKYLRELTRSISKREARALRPLNEKRFIKESTETTNISVINSKGQAIAMTLTLNGNYGSGVISRNYGIALNNEMDDFTTRPGKPNMFGLIQGKANEVHPKKRPLSSMSPTIAKKSNKAVIALGAAGGPRIITSVFQTLYRTIVHDYNIEHALFSPRLHHQFLPNKVRYEKQRISPYILQGLKNRGHKVAPIHGVGVANGVKRNKEGLLEGAADFRGEGFSGGL